MKALAIALLLGSAAFAAEAPVCFDAPEKVADEKLAAEFNDAQGVWVGLIQENGPTGMLQLYLPWAAEPEGRGYKGLVSLGAEGFKGGGEANLRYCALGARRWLVNQGHPDGYTEYELSGDSMRVATRPTSPDAVPTQWTTLRRLKVTSPGFVSNQ